MKKKLSALAAAVAVAASALVTPTIAGAAEFEPAPLHGSSTGSSALDITVAFTVIGGVVKLIVDNVQPLAETVEGFATEIGVPHLVGSSGVSFNLEELSS